MKKNNKFQTIKAIYYTVAIPAMLFVLSYFAISFNFEFYSVHIFFGFIKTVAIYTFILDAIILAITFIFKERNTFFHAIEWVGKYTIYILGIALAVLFIGAPFTLFGYTDLAGTAGAILVWAIFINLYLLVMYLIAKKFE